MMFLVIFYVFAFNDSDDYIHAKRYGKVLSRTVYFRILGAQLSDAVRPSWEHLCAADQARLPPTFYTGGRRLFFYPQA
jgi:hypothetical protein